MTVSPVSPALRSVPAASWPARAAAPQAMRHPAPFTLHGTTVPDDFAWLKAENWREVLKDGTALPAPIRAHLEAENAYSAAHLADLGPLRETLVREMRGRIKEDDDTVPQPDGPFAYFTRYRDGGQHPLVCRERREGGEAAILIDGDKEGEGRAYFDLADAAHSPDHARIAWSADVAGSELYTIRVRDLATGRDLEDEIRATSGEAVWCADGQHFYYVEVDENHRPARVRRHRIGDAQADDVLIYAEESVGWFVDIDETTSGAFVLIRISDHETSETWLVDRADPAAVPRLVAARTPLVLYDVEHHGLDLLIRTNADGAEDFKLCVAPVAHPERARWRDLVPHRPGTMLLYQFAMGRHLVRLERENANPRIVVRDIWTAEEHAIAFDEEAYSLGLDPGYEFDSGTIRFTYSSLTTPNETWDYDLATRERRLRKRQAIPSGFDPARYVTRRIQALAPDGESVPVSLIHRRDLALDGTAPCLLYGYGSYGSSMSASFRTNLLSLVDRGFVYAIAHIRGGTEKGWRWYLDGKREKKTNTFTDFVAAGRALASAGYTSEKRIVALGGSAGGMLMGAVANLAPELFAGIVAEVPFVDVLNTMLDGDLPLTPPEWPEWGNPTEEGAFRTILAYSPYDNVRPLAYPAILALGGLTDPRVTYWEPAKWVARLRAETTGADPILLRINMDAGHGGAAGRFDRLEEVALIYAFACKVVGLA